MQSQWKRSHSDVAVVPDDGGNESLFYSSFVGKVRYIYKGENMRNQMIKIAKWIGISWELCSSHRFSNASQ